MRFFPTDIYYFILVIPAFLFSLFAQLRIKSTFNRYSKVPLQRQMTGEMAARMILDINGITNIRVTPIQGSLTDHYSNKESMIGLSKPTYAVSSIAAVGVAAHEAGHAVQYHRQYFPIQVRQAIVPVTQFGSMASYPVIAIGFFMNSRFLILAGIILFSLVALFQLITLPVEFNASKRALENLRASNMLNPGELDGVKKVLNAAAMTYVAALAVSLMSLIRVILLSRRRN